MEKEAKRPTKNMITDDQALVNFLNAILEKATNFTTHSDSQVNILIGISTAIIALSVASINSGHNSMVFSILGVFSTLAVLVGLYAVHPPKRLRKRGQGESLFYNKKITRFPTPEEYTEKLKEILQDKNVLINNYSTEIYNLYKYYYRPKRKLFNLARNLLMSGIILSFLAYIVRLFI